MLWIIYEDYFKQIVRTTSFIKNLKWYVWLIFTLLLLVTLNMLINYLQTQNNWILITTYLVAGITGLYFGYELNKTVIKNIGDNKDIFDHNIISMRSILQQRNINKLEQIDLLISQINEEIPGLKLSEKVSKSIYTINTILLMPMIILLIEWILNYNDSGMKTVITILSLCLMVLGLFYIINPLLKQVLDSPYRKLNTLKRTLEDIKLLDYLK